MMGVVDSTADVSLVTTPSMRETPDYADVPDGAFGYGRSPYRTRHLRFSMPCNSLITMISSTFIKSCRISKTRASRQRSNSSGYNPATDHEMSASSQFSVVNLGGNTNCMKVKRTESFDESL